MLLEILSKETEAFQKWLEENTNAKAQVEKGECELIEVDI